MYLSFSKFINIKIASVLYFSVREIVDLWGSPPWWSDYKRVILLNVISKEMEYVKKKKYHATQQLFTHW